MSSLSLNDKLFVIKSKIFSKRNILHLLVSIVLILILEVCITSVVEISKAQNKINNDSLLSRELIFWEFDDKKIDQVNKIDHIMANVSEKYYNPYPTEFDEFYGEDLSPDVVIYPLLYSGEISFNGNIKDLKYGEIVCPKKFYPYSLYVGDSFDTVIKDDYILNGDKLVGKKLLLKKSNSKSAVDANLKDVNLTVVGTYDNISLGLPINACFVSKETFDSVKSNVSGETGHVDEFGNKTYKEDYYEGRLLILDDAKNKEYVKIELAKLGLHPSETFTMDGMMTAMLVYLPLFILLIVGIIILTVISNFVKKKIRYSIKRVVLLKSFGYRNKDIISIESLENLFILIVSFISSIIIYIPIFIIVKKKYMVELEYDSISFNIPILWFLLLFILLALLIMFITRRRIKRELSYDISLNLSEGNI